MSVKGKRSTWHRAAVVVEQLDAATVWRINPSNSSLVAVARLAVR